MTTLIYWQESYSKAYWLARKYYDEGDFDSAVYWQENAANTYRHFLTIDGAQ